MEKPSEHRKQKQYKRRISNTFLASVPTWFFCLPDRFFFLFFFFCRVWGTPSLCVINWPRADTEEEVNISQGFTGGGRISASGQLLLMLDLQTMIPKHPQWPLNNKKIIKVNNILCRKIILKVYKSRSVNNIRHSFHNDYVCNEVHAQSTIS